LWHLGDNGVWGTFGVSQEGRHEVLTQTYGGRSRGYKGILSVCWKRGGLKFVVIEKEIAEVSTCRQRTRKQAEHKTTQRVEAKFFPRVPSGSRGCTKAGPITETFAKHLTQKR